MKHDDAILAPHTDNLVHTMKQIATVVLILM